MRLHSEEDTRGLARRVALAQAAFQTLGLCGDLGAGKTTFVRYLIAELAGDPTQVASPSFTLQHEYLLPSGVVIEHWDLYRLRALPAELLEPPGRGIIRIIEWPDRVEGCLEALDLAISLRITGSEEREVAISGPRAGAIFKEGVV